MRTVIAALLCLHGLIHLIGVMKEWRWAEVPALSGGTTLKLPATASIAVGALWLASCLALLAAAALLIAHHDRWWITAAIAVATSQLLVLYAWPDAKAGTLANVALAVAIVIGAGYERFIRDGDAAIHELLVRTSGVGAAPVERAELEHLPAPVARWLEGAGVVGKPRAVNVRLKQRGELRTSVEQDFAPARADQYFSVNEPGFVWRVQVPMLHVPIIGRDSYAGGRGRMQIKALGAIPLVDAQGEPIDQGTLLRFLGELVWFPSAALAPYVRWEEVDQASARAHMSYGGVSAWATFYFDAQGRVERMSASRYLAQGDAPATLEPWAVRMRRWASPDGVLIPVEGDVTWELKSGDFTYYRWHITELQQNVTEPYVRD